MNILECISNTSFEKIIDIKFNNINSGFDKYSNGILENKDNSLPFEENEKSFFDFFEKALSLNHDCCYVDFYIKNLDKSEIRTLYSHMEGKYK